MKKFFTVLMIAFLSFSFVGKPNAATTASYKKYIVPLTKQEFTVKANKNGSLSYLGAYKGEDGHTNYTFITRGDLRYAFDSTNTSHTLTFTNGKKQTISLGKGSKSLINAPKQYLIVRGGKLDPSLKLARFDNKNVSKIPTKKGQFYIPSIGKSRAWNNLSLVSESNTLKTKVTSISLKNGKSIKLSGTYTAKVDTYEPMHLLFYQHSAKQKSIMPNDTNRSIKKGQSLKFTETFTLPTSFPIYDNESPLWSFLLGDNVINFNFLTGKAPTTAPLSELISYDGGDKASFKPINFDGKRTANNALFYKGYSLLPMISYDYEMPYFNETVFPLGKSASTVSFQIGGSPIQSSTKATYTFYVVGDDYRGIDGKTNKPMGKVLFRKSITERTPVSGVTVKTKGVSTIHFVITSNVPSLDPRDDYKTKLFPLIIGSPSMNK